MRELFTINVYTKIGRQIEQGIFSKHCSCKKTKISFQPHFAANRNQKESMTEAKFIGVNPLLSRPITDIPFTTVKYNKRHEHVCFYFLRCICVVRFSSSQRVNFNLGCLCEF